MPERLTKIGNLLNSWTAIIIVVFGMISGVFGLIYTIRSNSSGIEELKIVIQDNNKLVTREFEIQSQRSDKRYTRAMRTAVEIKMFIEKIEDRQYELTKEVFYLKGKVDNE